MSQTIANFNHEYQFSQLDTYDYTIQTAGTHNIAVKLTDVTSLSGVTIVIKKNSTTLSTLADSALNEMNAFAQTNCSVNDVIHVQVTSTTASDAGPNQLTGFITITRIGA